LLTEKDQDEQRLTREKLKRALRNAVGTGRQSDEFQDDAYEILRRCIELLRDSPARMVLVNLEDLWLETQSQNIPSTATQNPNWRRKARYSLEDIVQNPQVLELLHHLNQGFCRGAND
jgi:4-alpha-glucanotransferase